MASSDELSKTRWRAGMWPNSPPPLPALGFEGPIGLWEGGAFVSYELAEHQGFFGDKRLRHPPMRPSEDRWTANLRRYVRWEREEQSGRGEIYLQVGRLDLDDVDAILDFVSTFDVLNVRALDPPRVERQWYALAPPRPLPLRVLRHYPGLGDKDGPVMASAFDCTLREAVVATCQAERDAAPIWVINETIEEFRWGARAIRDLHTAWCCLRDGGDPRSQLWANPRMPRPTDDRGHAVSATKSFLECTVSDTRRRLLALSVSWTQRRDRSTDALPSVPDTGSGLLKAIDHGAAPGTRRLSKPWAPAPAALRDGIGELDVSTSAMRAAIVVLTAAAALAVGTRMVDNSGVQPAAAASGDEAVSVARTPDGFVMSKRLRGLPRPNHVSWFAESAKDGRWVWFVQIADSTGSASRASFWPRRSTRSLLRLDTLRPITTGSYDSYITGWARYFKGLRSPVRLRALPDPQGVGAPPSKLARRARARIRTIFLTEGAVNVRWLRTSPNIGHS